VRALDGDLDPERVRALAPSVRDHCELLSALAFLRREFGLPLPARFAVDDSADGLSLAGVLREGRLRCWGIPGWRGWARLLAGRKKRGKKANRRRLRWGDLPLGVFDRFQERAAMRRLVAASR